MSSRFRLPLLPILRAATAAPLFGQTQNPKPSGPPPPVIRATTRLIQVDVVVQNEKGEPVEDLKQEDFSILDQGKPQQVALFSARSATSRERSQLPVLPPRLFSNRLGETGQQAPHSVTVILFDTVNTSISDIPYAREQVIRFLSPGDARRKFIEAVKLHPGDAVAVRIVALIDALFAIDAEARTTKLDHAARYILRREKVPALLQKIKGEITAAHATALPSSALGKAANLDPVSPPSSLSSKPAAASTFPCATIWLLSFPASPTRPSTASPNSPLPYGPQNKIGPLHKLAASVNDVFALTHTFRAHARPGGKVLNLNSQNTIVMLAGGDSHILWAGASCKGRRFNDRRIHDQRNPKNTCED